MRALALSLLVLSVPAAAVVPKDFVSARAVGFGGTRAAASGNEAIFLNPAALGATRQYTAQFDYSHSTAPPGADDGGDGIVLSVHDSVSNPQFPTGIAYRYMALGPGGQGAKGWVTDVAMGLPLGAFSLGARVTYLSYTSDGGREFSQFTGDVGGLVNLGYMYLGLVGYNLIKVDSPDAARGLSTGVAFTDQAGWRLAGDLRWDWGAGGAKRSWGVGAEYLLADAIPLRAGYENDAVRNTRFWSGGVGIVARQFGFDVSYRRDMTTGEGIWAFSAKLFGN